MHTIINNIVDDICCFLSNNNILFDKYILNDNNLIIYHLANSNIDKLIKYIIKNEYNFSLLYKINDFNNFIIKKFEIIDIMYYNSEDLYYNTTHIFSVSNHLFRIIYNANKNSISGLIDLKLDSILESLSLVEQINRKIIVY